MFVSAEYKMERGVEEKTGLALDGLSEEVTQAMSPTVYWLELVQHLQLPGRLENVGRHTE